MINLVEHVLVPGGRRLRRLRRLRQIQPQIGEVHREIGEMQREIGEMRAEEAGEEDVPEEDAEEAVAPP